MQSNFSYIYVNPQDNKSLSKINSVEYYRGIASLSENNRQHKNIEPNITIKDSFNRGDYEIFRPEESVPKKKKDIIRYCMQAYRKIGIVRNIIDLMGDFCVQGIKIQHPNKQRQKFLRSWAKKVNFKEVSERFANLLFRCGNVVVKRSTAKLPVAEEDRMVSQGIKQPADNELPQSIELQSRTIPIGYTFLNPISLEVIGGELAQFTGKQIIGLNITKALQKAIRKPSQDEKLLVEYVPNFIKELVIKGLNVIPLEQDKLYVSHYKKDDWETWADPMTYSILDDLILLEKMKLADLAALDGAISQVRLWKLGDKEKGVWATETQFERLANILSTNPGNGVYDVIWDDYIQVEELKSEVYKFLGSEKYEPVLSAIYAGLGVPQTLTGSSTGGSGTTNNFISIQTMIQRLEYVRSKITEFWEHELNLLQKSLGYREPARISFDIMTLNDESSMKKLLIDLWDRNIISDELIVEAFKGHPEIEIVRQRREERERKRKLRLDKKGPYFPSDKEHEYAKIALQQGYINPDDVGLERISEEETPFDLSLEMKKSSSIEGEVKKGTSGQGRPKNSGDKTKRKEKKFSVRTASLGDETSNFMVKNIWAREALKSISEILNPIVLKMYSKSSLRELTNKEYKDLEYMKFSVFSNISPYEDITEERIVNIIDNGCRLPESYASFYNKLVAASLKISKKDNLTSEEKRSIQAATYALLN